MSVSLPSPQIVVADVPEVRDFSASNFVYNFFTAGLKEISMYLGTLDSAVFTLLGDV